MKDVSVLLFVFDIAISAARTRENIAYKKEAEQSSTYMYFTALEAKYANDGLLDQVIVQPAVCASTRVDEPNYWWAVDLGGSYEIGSITIYNRKNWGERLYNFSVIIYNPVVANWSSFSDNPGVLCYFHEERSPDILNLTCDRKVKGRYLQIYKGHRSLDIGDCLTLCEVLVFEGGTRNQFCREERRRPLEQISTHMTTVKTVCAALCNQKGNCIGFESKPGGICDLYQTSMTVDTADSEAPYYEKC